MTSFWRMKIMNNLNLFLLIIAFIPTAIILAFIPYLTRKTENFGVSIPETIYYRDDFKAMRKKYAFSMLIITIVLTTVFFIVAFQGQESTIFIMYTALIIGYIIASFALYLPFHYKMKAIKKKEKWQAERKQTIVIDTKFRNEKIVASNWWFLIPGLITVATIIFTFVIYEKIPDQVPIHTSFSGKVTYSDKSPGNVLILPFSQIFTLVVCLISNYAIKNSKQQVSAQSPETSKQQNIIFRKRWSIFIVVMSVLISLMFTFMQMTFIYQSLLKYEDIVLISVIFIFLLSVIIFMFLLISLIFTFMQMTFIYQSLLKYEDIVLISVILIILLGVIILTISVGQGGSRVKVDNVMEDGVIDRDNDRYWKLGQIYVNKNDPSLFVEKRFGVGWTINFGRPLAWGFLLGIIVLAFLPLFFI